MDSILSDPLITVFGNPSSMLLHQLAMISGTYEIIEATPKRAILRDISGIRFEVVGQPKDWKAGDQKRITDFFQVVGMYRYESERRIGPKTRVRVRSTKTVQRNGQKPETVKIQSKTDRDVATVSTVTSVSLRVYDITPYRAHLAENHPPYSYEPSEEAKSLKQQKITSRSKLIARRQKTRASRRETRRQQRIQGAWEFYRRLRGIR